MKTNISISKISYVVTTLVLLLFTGCRKEKGEPVYTFECIANEQFVLTGANYWYDKMYHFLATTKENKNNLKFGVPYIFIKTAENQEEMNDEQIEDSQNKAFNEYPIVSLIFDAMTSPRKLSKRTKQTFTYGASDTEIKISMKGPYFYNVQIKSGHINSRVLSNTSPKPYFYASFEFDLDVEVKTDPDGETIDTFPLKLTDGVMSYKPM